MAKKSRTRTTSVAKTTRENKAQEILSESAAARNMLETRILFESRIIASKSDNLKFAIDSKPRKLVKSCKLKSNEWKGVLAVPEKINQATKARMPKLVTTAAAPSLSIDKNGNNETSLVRVSQPQVGGDSDTFTTTHQPSQTQLIKLKGTRKLAKPTWHAPWKLKTVISGHTGWVRALAVDVSNECGAGDRIIKVWDLASCTLKLSLTGHISTVRALQVSTRHPYLFSAGEDKQIKCWDLETNKVIRQYHGHLSGIYTLSLHPTLDILVSGGRDATCRVWDMRTRQQVHALTGHLNTVGSVESQAGEPQIVSASEDSTVKMWDLRMGKCMNTLTHHKKGVRCVKIHPVQQGMLTASTSTIKQWRLPGGNFLQNYEGQNTVINTMAINQDNVVFSGGDNGSMYFWDWKSGYNFQTMQTKAQSGSLENEAGVFCSVFDQSGTRLITGEADKSIKIWAEDLEADQASHPITGWQPKLAKLYGL